MKTIVIVDDEPDVANVVVAALEDEGYRAVVAFNGVDGLKCVKQTTPDLLICDLMMPFMDGVTMCQQVRSDPRFQTMPIAFASVMDETVISAKFDDYDGYLRKPFRVVALLHLVNSLLERHSAVANE